MSVCHFQMRYLTLSDLNPRGYITCRRSHYDTVVLRRVFAEWRDEWWTSRREWSLTLRAECHRRYNETRPAAHRACWCLLTLHCVFQVLSVQLGIPKLANFYVIAKRKKEQSPSCSVIRYVCCTHKSLSTPASGKGRVTNGSFVWLYPQQLTGNRCVWFWNDGRFSPKRGE